MKFSKKGSMQLSIEAIIILVIAMVLLGLGIAFISGFFKTGTTKLMEPFDDIQFGCSPTATDPLKTTPSQISVKAGDQQKVRFCYYTSQELYKAKVEFKNCVCTEAACMNKKPTLIAPEVPHIDRADIGKFDSFLKAVDGADLTPANYICTVAIKGSATSTGSVNEVETAQITIAVT
ncbi:TPA: hypothetical protein HA251_05685 [Candidatus Woesearchaeota archaeon]|nr:hypothetical protein [Candidatus Woesearchaeota archaeon]